MSSQRKQLDTVLQNTLLAMYKAQTHIVVPYLKNQGFSHEAALASVEWGSKMQAWMKLVSDDEQPLIWAWGAARESSLNTFKGSEALVQNTDAIAKHCVNSNIGVVHGSGSKGFMGLVDRYFSANSGTIFHIPLLWPHDTREFLGEGAKETHRSAPQLTLAHRTEVFGLAKPCGIIIGGTSGVGTMLELYYAIVSWQLRNKIVTVFSQWDEARAPEIMLLDFPYDCSDVSEKWEKLEGFNLSEMSGWMFDPTVNTLRLRIMMESMNQESVSLLTVLRVGQGLSIKSKNRIGPKILYFDSPEELGAYVVDSCLTTWNSFQQYH